MFPGLVLQWSAQLPVPPREIALSTLTAPLVVEGVTTSQGRQTLLFVVGSDDTVFAIDADSGKVVWQKRFPNTLTPPQIATWLCSNTQNATPVIDKQKGIIYLNTSDGKLRGLSLSTGDERMTPTDFVTPFARNWSLNLIDDVDLFTDRAWVRRGDREHLRHGCERPCPSAPVASLHQRRADRLAPGGAVAWSEAPEASSRKRPTARTTRRRGASATPS